MSSGPIAIPAGAAPAPLALPPSQLISADRETHVFWSLRKRLVSSAVRRMLRTARLRVTLVVVLSIVFWCGLFYLFYSGFDMLGDMLMSVMLPLYNAFFTSLMAMLTISSAIIMYSSMYCSPEAAFLMTTPARPQRIFSYLFHEALWFSSWGFILLGSPMLVAAGVVIQAPWYYFALLGPLMLAFLWIPATLGAILCMVFIDRLGRWRRGVMWGIGILAGAGLVWLGWTISHSARGDMLTPDWFEQISDRLRFAEIHLLPSWWFSEALYESTRRPVTIGASPWSEGVLFLALLISNGLFFYQVSMWLAARVYRSSYSRMQTERSARRGGRTGFVDRLLLGSRPRPPSAMRLLLTKDLRLFRRDPVQWAQFFIFFGLLMLYFINIRRFNYDDRAQPGANARFSTMIGFLNLAVVGLILFTFTTRFIFPMISLEGRRFWILGPLPLRRETIVWTKFAFAACGSLIPCCALMWISDSMLGISLNIILSHQVSCAMLCLGLSGIAVGLGAKMPELHEQSPSKIAAGFGGTLNLVISAVFIVLTVMFTAVPYHFSLPNAPGPSQTQFERIIHAMGSDYALLLGLALTVITGVIATVWPLRMGLKAFREMDF